MNVFTINSISLTSLLFSQIQSRLKYLTILTSYAFLFSLGFDVRDHYKDFGGNHAAFYAPSADIYGVKAYNMLDIPDLHTLGTVVVDYRGYRVTAQSIIPGMLHDVCTPVY